MTKATKWPDGTYDRFDDHLERGDRVRKIWSDGTDEEVIFQEVTEDGFVKYHDESGTSRADPLPIWKLRWQRGELEIVDEPDIGELPIVPDADPAEQVMEIARLHRSYLSSSRYADAGCRTAVDGQRIRIDFDELDGRDGVELTTAIYLGAVSWVLAQPGVSRCDWDELTEVSGVMERHAEALRAAGYESIDQLKAATQGELAAVKGITDPLAARIKADIGGLQVDDEIEVETEGDSDTPRDPVFDSMYMPMHTLDPKGADSLPLQMRMEQLYQEAQKPETDEADFLLDPFDISLPDEIADETEDADDADRELSEYGQMFEDAVQEFEKEMGEPPVNFGVALLWATVTVDWDDDSSPGRF